MSSKSKPSGTATVRYIATHFYSCVALSRCRKPAHLLMHTKTRLFRLYLHSCRLRTAQTKQVPCIRHGKICEQLLTTNASSHKKLGEIARVRSDSQRCIATVVSFPNSTIRGLHFRTIFYFCFGSQTGYWRFGDEDRIAFRSRHGRSFERSKG